MRIFYHAAQAEAFGRLVAQALHAGGLGSGDTVSCHAVAGAADLPDEPGATFVVAQSQGAEIPPLFYTALRAKGYTLWHVSDSWARHRLEQDKLNADTSIPAGNVARHTVSGSDAADDDDMPRGPASTGPMEG